MESNGKIGDIMISETTKKLLEKDPTNNYNFIWHKYVEAPKIMNNPISGYLV
jgi:hypothetical protein